MGGAVSFARLYLEEAGHVLGGILPESIDRVVEVLAHVRASGGTVWTLGLGGSAATASHFVNDLRKLCRLDARSLVDNVAELTARANDEGWPRFAADALAAHARAADALFVVSVGGGACLPSGELVSAPIVAALEEAQARHMAIVGVVGRDGGATAQLGDAVVVIPPTFPDRVTAHTEGLASVVLHAIVSSPRLATRKTKW